MSVQPGPTEKRYAANGVTTIYAVPFLVIEAGDLKVYLNGVLQTSGYTQTGVGNPTSSITFTIPPTGDLYLVLEVPFQRLVDYQENGDFLSSTVNRDFDRIWQALKQLLMTTGRSPVLGTNDVDGAGFYRAKGNGLIDLASAAGNPSAATNWKDVLDYVQSILATGQGPVNNAANVLYAYPDATIRTVQSLSSFSGAGGALGIGFRGRTVGARLDDCVHVTDDHGAPGGGAKGDGVTDDYAAIIAARDFALLTGRKTLVFPKPAVAYATKQMLELGVYDGFSIVGEGFPTIMYTGTSAVLAVVSLDRTVGTGRYGLSFSNFNIQGNANVQEGLYMRAISHSTVRNVRAWNCAHSGIRVNSGVCNLFDNVRVTSVGGLPGAPAVIPVEGIVLDEPVADDYVAWCTFINAIAENVTENGFRLNSAVGCQFIGGTSEGNKRGVYIAPGCSYNALRNVDFESNGVNGDVTINGNGNVIDNCQTLSFASSINFSVQAAEGTIFIHSNLRAVNLQATSRDTKFFGCRFSDNGALGITGSGTYSCYGCVKEDNSGAISSSIPDRVLSMSVGGPSVAGVTLTVRGSGATSATSSIRAANPAGDVVMQCRDDGVFLSPVSYARTTASAANVFIGSDGALARSTSALKYKDIVGPITDEMIDAFLGIDGVLYTQKGDAEGGVFAGFIAEDFHAHPILRPFIHYGPNMEVEGLMYERVSVLQKAAHNRTLLKLASLDERLKVLEASMPG